MMAFTRWLNIGKKKERVASRCGGTFYKGMIPHQHRGPRKGGRELIDWD
ncbi:hypothetical protein E2C01_062491 [Portunus trituberculatus]|uniref:Uncharacterized protein n=1 Tax=Portunus trituberculatus TaxID=210409 RepID=A0A5B7HDT7_PORTR|nr:hypothetical protein [Portunus trituberculatus]